MTFTDLDTIIAAELGPDWRWLARRCAEHEGKPGAYLVNLSFDPGGQKPIYFPVFGETVAIAFSESFRRAVIWKEEGVR